MSITQKDLEDTRDRIFFLLGTSRSGSTLLQSMLSSHSKLVIPPETHFFHSCQNLKKQFSRSGNKEEFRDKLIEFWYDNKTRIRDGGLNKNDVLREAKKLGISNPVDLFTLQLTMYRVERDKKIVGEKTPRHMMHIPEILNSYPKAKIISLFRDPRAKAYSEIKAQFGSSSVMISTKRWRKYVELHDQFKEELPDHQYMMIRYSDLISNVEDTLRTVCNFLKVSFEEDMLNYYNREETGFAKGEKSWKKQTLKPLQENKNEEWKSSLKDWEIALIEKTASDYLEKMDYPKWLESGLGFPKQLFYQSVDFSRSVWSTLTGLRDEGYVDPNRFKYK